MTELLTSLRAKCRELETQPQIDDVEPDFKYQARLLWWEYCQKTQMESTMEFREFWGNNNTYPRTIRMIPLLEIYRAKCREYEKGTWESDADFKYSSHSLWWEYRSLITGESTMTFREFWNNEATYPKVEWTTD